MTKQEFLETFESALRTEKVSADFVEEQTKLLSEKLASLPDDYLDRPASLYPGTPLAIGSRGDSVRDLQTYLNLIADYYPVIPKIAVDGVFGYSTLDAVNAFQREFGIPVSQNVGFPTWDAVTRIYTELLEGR